MNAETGTGVTATVDLAAEYEASGVAEELIGLAPVKRRIRETAALSLVDRARRNMGLAHETPTLPMSFTGNPGTGKTSVAVKMAGRLRQLGYLRKGHLVSVTRDDLVGQCIGHTAPKTRDVLKKAMGGVLFIDEAYCLYKPDNARDDGQEAIEILLQVMENSRDDLVVIMAGYADRMDGVLAANPGFRSRIRAIKSAINFNQKTIPAAIAHAVVAGADVITMAMGGPTRVSATEKALRDATRAGPVITCAAGTCWPKVVFPAAYAADGLCTAVAALTHALTPRAKTGGGRK